MNKKIKWIIGTFLLAVTTLYALDNGPGTSNDPLVTKSYVDNKIAQLTGQDSKEQENSLGTYQVVTIEQGKAILGKQGTEIIVRGGEAVIIGSEAGGLQDMTDGVDIEEGTSAPRYHLLIVPKEDGRGLIATKPLIVMVRGGYSIQ